MLKYFSGKLSKSDDKRRKVFLKRIPQTLCLSEEGTGRKSWNMQTLPKIGRCKSHTWRLHTDEDAELVVALLLQARKPQKLLIIFWCFLGFPIFVIGSRFFTFPDNILKHTFLLHTFYICFCCILIKRQQFYHIIAKTAAVLQFIVLHSTAWVVQPNYIIIASTH